jgi:hypothetical protein
LVTCDGINTMKPAAFMSILGGLELRFLCRNDPQP